MGGLAQSIAEGFASAAGDQNTVNRFEQQTAEKNALSHAELRDQTQSVLADVTGLQQKRAQLDKNSPTYDKDLAANDQALHDARQVLQDLYHPEKNPGALAHLGGFIRQHLSKNPPQKTPAQFKEDMPSRQAKLDAAAAPNASPAEADKMKEVSDAYQKTFGIPLPDDKKKQFFEHLYGGAPLEPKPEAENWQTVPEVTLKDGSKVSAQHNTKTGEWTDLSGNPIPKEMLSLGATVPQKTAGGVPKVGSFGDFLVQAYGSHPTAKQYEEGRSAWAQSGAGKTVGTHTITVPQPDGSLKLYQVETTSQKEFPGAAALPKNAGEAKHRIQKPTTPPSGTAQPKPAVAAPSASGVAKPGDTVGGRSTAPEIKLRDDIKKIEPMVKDMTDFLETNNLTKAGEGGLFSGSSWMEKAKVEKAWQEYSHGIPPSDKDLGQLVKMAAAIRIMGAAPWMSMGRGKYLYAEVVQHLPSPTDTPAQLYEKMQFYKTVLEDAKGSLPPALQEGGANAAPDATSAPANPYR